MKSRPQQWRIALPDGVHLAVNTDHPTIALSPDGSQLFFVGVKDGVRRIYRRDLADPAFAAVEIEGTEEAGSPFLSPDGEQIAFFVGQRLRSVSPDSGVPTDIILTTPISVNRGAAWIDATTFVYAPSTNGPLRVAHWTPDQGLLTTDEWSDIVELPAPSVWAERPAGPS